MKIAYLDCFSGISGDMFLAALVDAGVPFSVLEEAVAAVGLDVRLELRRVDRSGIGAAKVDVIDPRAVSSEAYSDGAREHAHDSGPQHDRTHTPGEKHAHVQSHIDPREHPTSQEGSHSHGRPLSLIQRMITESSLPGNVREIAHRAFQLLGDAEARIHNVPVEKIHFHEVGAVDAIADIVAAAAGCCWIAAERWICSPLNVGGGHVHCAHGVLPVPAPATLALVGDLPIYSSGVRSELVTPTGAALLRALQVSPSSAFPAMRVNATGYGAGFRDAPGRPNVLRLVIGEMSASERGPELDASVSSVGIIEAAIDDATPEVLAYVAEKLLKAGAIDVYRAAVQMKKDRAGTQLTVLCRPESRKDIQALIFAETTTLGLRYREDEKISLKRDFVPVDTLWGPVKVKIASYQDGQVVNVAPEFEDCRRIAEQHRVSLKLVMQAATAAYWLKEARA